MEKLVKVAGEESFRIANSETEVFVTKSCGMMAPVTFFRNGSHPIQPYYINPWHSENHKDQWRLLEVLRGDFFCIPFGGNNAWQSEEHPIHGESANNEWSFVSLEQQGSISTLTLEMATRIRPGTIKKEIFLKDGQNVIYQRHTVKGFNGPSPLGHHATLRADQGEMLIDTSGILGGRTGCHSPDNHNEREYYSLASEAEFSSLKDVPTIWKDSPTADLSIFPSRHGFIDIAQIFAKQQNTPAWVAVTKTEAGYIWFALKDPKILPSTVLWTENHGRHSAPWKGRNCCIGIEDVCAYAANGLGDSVSDNPVSAQGIRTHHTLSDNKDFVVNYIHGVLRLPEGFDRVNRMDFTENRITLHSCSDEQISADVDYSFLYEKNKNPS